MSPKFLFRTNRVWFRVVLVGAFIIVCTSSFDCATQSRKKSVLPRVGTIKDYPATGLMTGCGNLYFYRAGDASASDATYVFLSAGDGSNAWMNLGGRDVRLRQVRPSRRGGKRVRGFSYLWNGWAISVVSEPFKPEGAPVADEDPAFKMKITIRNGRTVRVVQAVGDTDC
jgi:hypothetical protein